MAQKQSPGVLESLFIKVAGLDCMQLYEKEISTQVFFGKFCKIFKSNY